MRKNSTPPKTPLLALLRMLTAPQRQAFAVDAGTATSYLYALATCQRCSCSAKIALGIEQASERLCLATGGKTPVVHMHELAVMCAVG